MLVGITVCESPARNYSNSPTRHIHCVLHGPSAVAMDGKGRNSPYTAALLKYIAVLSAPAERVFKNVRKDPIRSTAGKQVPWDTSSLASAFYFNSEKATDIEKGSGVEDLFGDRI